MQQQESTPAAAPTGRELSSPTIAKVAAALAAAQGEFPLIPRDRTVTVVSRKQREDGSRAQYTFSYAPLATVLEKVRPALAKHELALTQAVVPDGKGESVRTVLIHSSGEYLANETPLFASASDNASQGYASGLTYARRYGVTTLLCVAADDDDDGNGTDDDAGRERVNAGRAPQGRTRPAKPAPAMPQARSDAAPAPLSDGPRRLLEVKAKAAGLTVEEVEARFGPVNMGNLNATLAALAELAGGGAE